ncbi:diguanylate cyclase [Ammoniphilus sp. YIM 78166]|uniref:sensor domain-containing diguanylate cyclase n=1 Tax=Ammoniphilus sp. YIM 78166 TaxID=1644106 RepID=UPI001F100D0F|nr:diguanylate cyclase [Ammoniphilus sp. YIM 78166]
MEESHPLSFSRKAVLIEAFNTIAAKMSPQRFLSTSGFIFLCDEAGQLVRHQEMSLSYEVQQNAEMSLDKRNPWYEVTQVDDNLVTSLIHYFGDVEGTSYYLGLKVVGRFSQECLHEYLLGLMVAIEERIELTRSHEILFEITKKIHSSIDVDEVLHSIVSNINGLFPSMQTDLWLSHDSSTTLSFRTFNFDMGTEEISLRAFMEGNVMMVQNEQPSDGHVVRLAAPLRGKQGIYGVLEMYADQQVQITSKDIELITILADTAGNAFENAQLYQQSQKLIQELLLINGMAKQLTKTLNLDEILKYVLDKLLETYEAEYCVILHYLPKEERFVVLASSHPEHIGRSVKNVGELARMTQSREGLIVSDAVLGEALLSSYRSLMGVPLVSGLDVEGAILVTDSRASAFSFDDFKLLEILTQHVNLAIKNASLHKEVERMVITDNLTKLHNRKFLNDRVSISVKQDKQGALILIDIDHFKKVNDTYGHQVGDEILIQVADILMNSVRKSDIAARWGGEELAVYLPGQTLETALEVSERVRSRIEQQTEPRVTVSLGVAAWREDLQEETVESLFYSADIALYEAKRSGRNQFRVAVTS